MQPATPLKLPGMPQVLAAAKSTGLSKKANSQPARSSNATLTGPRPSGVLQLVSESDTAQSGQKVLTLLPQPQPGQKVLTLLPQPQPGQKVLTLLPQPQSGQKVLTLLPQPKPSAENAPVLILQFSDDEPAPTATIMPLGVSEEEDEPAATLLQFED
jgi:hypothetical protein